MGLLSGRIINRELRSGFGLNALMTGRFTGLNSKLKPVFYSHSYRFQSSTTSNSRTADDLFESRWQQLENSINIQAKKISKDSNDNLKAVTSIFESISNFQAFIYGYDKLSPDTNPFIIKSNKLLSSVLKGNETVFNKELLRALLIQQPSYPTLETIINAYYSRDREAFVDPELAMIPFRKLLWDGNFQGALDYVGLTNGNQRFFNHRKQIIKRILGYFGGSLAGLILGIHGTVVTFFPELIDAGAGGTTFGIYGIYACIVTYFINCGFLAALSFSSKGLENGGLMFQHYTMPHDWFMKVEQMKMCSKILEADAEIHGRDGFATREVVNRIQGMGFEVNEPEQEIMLRQYWYSSGEGFVWVEPDLDPAELEWWDHLDDVGVKKVWDQDRSKLEAAERNEQVEEDDDNAELYFSESESESKSKSNLITDTDNEPKEDSDSNSEPKKKD